MIKKKRIGEHAIHAARSYKRTLDINCCNCDSNQRINVDSVSRLIDQYGISRNLLQQGFKLEFGMGIREYKLRQRMQLGRELLESGKEVKVVAFMLHYTKERTFCVAFKKHYGFTPAMFVEMLQD
jgi:AraC-like DNA-binding protein